MSNGTELKVAELQVLNEDYVTAYMSSDVEWYRQHLSDDFVCIESDGSILNKAGFLNSAAEGPDVAAYELKQVNVRIYGDVGLVQATGLFTRKDGSQGTSRYTDVYVNGGGGWKAVSAQITRSSKVDSLANTQ